MIMKARTRWSASHIGVIPVYAAYFAYIHCVQEKVSLPAKYFAVPITNLHRFEENSMCTKRCLFQTNACVSHTYSVSLVRYRNYNGTSALQRPLNRPGDLNPADFAISRILLERVFHFVRHRDIRPHEKKKHLVDGWSECRWQRS